MSAGPVAGPILHAQGAPQQLPQHTQGALWVGAAVSLHESEREEGGTKLMDFFHFCKPQDQTLKMACITMKSQLRSRSDSSLELIVNIHFLQLE